MVLTGQSLPSWELGMGPDPPLCLMIPSNLQGESTVWACHGALRLHSEEAAAISPCSQQANGGSTPYQAPGGHGPGPAPADPGPCWPMSTVSRANGHRTMFSVNLGVRTAGWARAFHTHNMGSWSWWVFAGAALVSTRRSETEVLSLWLSSAGGGVLGGRVLPNNVSCLDLRGCAAR